MKRFLKRYKVFTERRTILIAVAVAATLICLAGIWAITYLVRDYGGYAERLQANRDVAVRNGLFTDRTYISAIQDQITIDSENIIVRTKNFASTTGMIQDPKVEGNVPLFLDLFEQMNAAGSAKTAAPRPTEEAFDQDVFEVERAVHKLVAYSQKLSLAKDFMQKERVLKTASLIASNMDTRFSYSSYISRARAQLEILIELDYLNDIEVPAHIKRQMIQACMPFLKRPFHRTQMMRKEELRILNSFEISLGDLKVDKTSLNYKVPQKPSILSQFLQRVPAIRNALRSRVYEAFSTPIYRDIAAENANYDPVNTFASSTILVVFREQLREKPAATDLIYQYGSYLLDNEDYVVLSDMHQKMWRLTGELIQ